MPSGSDLKSSKSDHDKRHQLGLITLRDNMLLAQPASNGHANRRSIMASSSSCQTDCIVGLSALNLVSVSRSLAVAV